MASYNTQIDNRIGISVMSKSGESFESLMRRFKRSISKSGIMKDLQSKRYFEKPSQQRKRKKAESIKRSQKKEYVENDRHFSS